VYELRADGGCESTVDAYEFRAEFVNVSLVDVSSFGKDSIFDLEYASYIIDIGCVIRKSVRIPLYQPIFEVPSALVNGLQR
jgi:hypothetical protein